MSASMEVWWAQLPQRTRDWLVDNNGDLVPPEVVDVIRSVAGEPAEADWWVGGLSSTGLQLSDAAVDWVDAEANGERPEPPG